FFPVPRGRGARGLRLVDVPRRGPGFVQCGRVHHGARRPLVRRARHAGGEPRPHHRGGLRTDEPRNAPDVDPVGHLLFVRPLSRRDAAVCEGAPTHRAERCPPCRHDRWEPAPRAERPVRHRDGMGSRELRGVAADLPLALGPPAPRPPGPGVTFPRAAPAAGTRGPATAAARRGRRWRSDNVRLAHSPALYGARPPAPAARPCARHEATAGPPWFGGPESLRGWVPRTAGGPTARSKPWR